MDICISEEELCSLIIKRYEGIVCNEVYREKTFFYNPDKILPRGTYVCTIKSQDGPNDKASNLNRKDVYRLSCGLDEDEYFKRFGDKPNRPKKGQIIYEDIDFTELDKIMPHPIYAWMGWICVNKPSKDILFHFLELMDFSYKKAKQIYDKKMNKYLTEKMRYV